MTRATFPPGSPDRAGAAPRPRDQLEEADRLRLLGQLDRAESICNTLIRRYPDYVAALHTLGLVYLDKRNYGRALDCLVRASMLAPDNWMTLTALALAYQRLGGTEMAAQTLQRAQAIQPRDATILASLGEVYRDEQEFELAQEAYRQALAIDPNLEPAIVGFAGSLAVVGRIAEAATALGRALQRGLRSPGLLHVVTMLPADAIDLDLLGAVDRLAAVRSSADADEKNTLEFLRAAALDRAGRHDEAWRTLVAANRPLAAKYQAELKLDIARRERALARMRAMSPVAARRDENSPIPLFILGPSRSGKTTLERLIGAAWAGIKTGHEAPIVKKALRRTFQAAAIPASGNLDELPTELLPVFRDNYREEALRRAASMPVLTGTPPTRMVDAGILSAALPNVRFLLVKRDVEDVTWRIYMTKYATANPYAYDLKEIRDYVGWYNAMIDLMAEKLPHTTRVVSYEDMVAQPGAVLRMAGGLCDLPPVADAPPPGDDRGCAAPYMKFLRGS